jgi:hypothetical protein
MGKALDLLNQIRKVSVSDIIPHEKPNRAKVNAITKILKAGGKLPPIKLSGRKYTHYVQGPKGMEQVGFGYGIIDGHHRYEAYKRVFGKDYVFKPGQLDFK